MSNFSLIDWIDTIMGKKAQFPNYPVLDKINPIDSPILFNNLKNGYDVGLMQNDYNSLLNELKGTVLEDNIIDVLDTSTPIPNKNIESVFASDWDAHNYNPIALGNDVIDGNTGEVLATPLDGYVSPNHNYSPAANSMMQFISGGVPRIGDSDYTIDDLRKNGMSEPDILALIRRLANQGYKI